MLLEIKDLVVHYGKTMALHGLSLKVEEGSVVTLIGANGEGKSTTLKTISGLKTPTSGEVIFNGEKLNGIPAHDVVKKGIANTPEGRIVFADMSVYDNLMMGAYLRNDMQGINQDLERMSDC